MSSRKQQKIQKDNITDKIYFEPTEVTTKDIKLYGDVSRLKITNRLDQEVFLIPYLAISGHKFGYASVDDPVSKSPDNILNVLIAAAKKNR